MEAKDWSEFIAFVFAFYGPCRGRHSDARDKIAMKIVDLLKFRSRNRHSGSRRRNVTPAVPGTVENLEKRALLSATDGIVDGTDNYDRITIEDNTDTSTDAIVLSTLVKIESFSDANFTIQVGSTVEFSTNVRSIVVNGGANDDLIQISSVGSTGDLDVSVDAGLGADRLQIFGRGLSDEATYSPGGEGTGAGTFESATGPEIEFVGVEMVMASEYATLNVVTPAGADEIIANKADSGLTQIAGETDAVDLTPIQFFDVQNLVLDLGANDTEDANQDLFDTAGQGLDGSGLNVFTVKGGIGNDEFFIHPSTTTEINVDGGDPTDGSGDQLTVEFAGVLNYRLPQTVTEGAITSTSHATVNFTGLETVRSTAVTVLTPASGIVDTVRPSFSWTAAENATTYEVWVANRELGQRVLYATDLIDTTWEATSDLELGRHRVWVRSVIRGQASAWSQPLDFSVNVTPTAFLNATNEIDPTPTLVWDSAAGAEKYEVWVSNRTNGTSTTYTVTAADAQQAVGSLPRFTIPDTDALPLGNFRYSVRAFDATLTPTNWSPIRNFSIVTPPQIVEPSLPSIETLTTFEWTAVNGADRYVLYVNRINDDGSETTIIEKTDIVGTSYQVAESLTDGDYRFWVRAFNDTGGATVQSRWSQPSTFSVGMDIKPVITGPVGTASALSPTITWGAIHGVARYEVWIGDTTNSEPLELAERVYTNSYTTEMTLSAGKYFAWVRAVSPRGELTEWSEAFVFETNGGTSEITGPTGTTADFFPRFTWTEVSDAASYELFIRKVGDVGTGGAVEIRVPGITTNGYTPTAPLNNGTYRVWVRAFNSAGESGGWSEGSNFTIVDNASDVDSSTDGLLDGGLQMASLLEFPADEQPGEESESIPVQAPVVEQPGQPVDQIVLAGQQQPAADVPADPGDGSVVDPVEMAIDQIVSEWPKTNWWA